MEKQVSVEITGRILQFRRHGKKLAFALLRKGLASIRLIFDHSTEIKKGDYVCASGTWQETKGTTELLVTSCMIVARPASLNNLPSYIDRGLMPDGLNKLFLYSKFIEECHNFFRDRNFMPVSSPAIVNDWVKGQTGHFATTFYDSPAYLSISNMLYHHILAVNGFNSFYEIGKIFRQETPSTQSRLAEFTMLDISVTDTDLEGLMHFFEEFIIAILSMLTAFTDLCSLLAPIRFDRISYVDLVRESGGKTLAGHQLGSGSRKFLDQHFRSFVWVTNFPELSRPFYVKSVKGYGIDCQLWYRGVNYLAAGGERERSPGIIEKKILSQGKDPLKYKFYIDALDFGLPEFASIGMGVERFLAALIPGTHTADFSFFPRYKGKLYP